MLDKLLEQIDQIVNDQDGSPGPGASVNIIVGNSGTVIIGNDGRANSDRGSDGPSDSACSKIIRSVCAEMQDLKDQVRSLKQLVIDIYKRFISRAAKHTACRASTVTSQSAKRRVSIHNSAARQPADARKPTAHKASTQVNPHQPTLTRVSQSICPLTMVYRNGAHL